MKSKKLFSLVLIIALAITAVVMPLSARQSVSAETNGTKIVGYKYDVNYLLTSLGFSTLSGQSTVVGGRTVKYRLSKNGDTIIAENNTDEAEASFAIAGSQIEFKTIGEYTFEIYNGTTLEATKVITTVKTLSADTVKYRWTNSKDADYVRNMTNYLKDSDIKAGDTFVFPTLEGFVDKTYFPYADFNKTIYYAAPTATSFASTTATGFTVSEAGVYNFYVLFTDPLNNAMTTKDMVIGEGGWYNTNADGDKVGDVVIPIFSFAVEQNAAPEISVGTSENGYIGLTYEVDSLKIVASNYNTEYRLYKSEVYYDKDEFDSDLAYMNAVTSDAQTQELTNDEFDLSTLSFTPSEKGYYYVFLRVVDSNNLTEEAMTRAISVQSEFTLLKLETEFFKNNILSIVFLGISFLCFIGILVVLAMGKREDKVVIDVKETK